MTFIHAVRKYSLIELLAWLLNLRPDLKSIFALSILFSLCYYLLLHSIYNSVETLAPKLVNMRCDQSYC